MKLSKIFFVLFVMLNFFSISFADKNDQLTIKISKNLRCLICQGQSIYDSQSDFAVSMKILINKKIEQGLSEKEIYELLKDKYGEWIVYDTSFNKNTFILWGLPVLLFFLGGAIILRKLVFRKV
jgi:cytochrome c-type biogenesis protein CcmH